MKYTLFNRQTGEFGPIITGPDERVIEAHLSEVVGFKEGAWRRRDWRVEGDEIVPVLP